MIIAERAVVSFSSSADPISGEVGSLLAAGSEGCMRQ